MWNITPVYGHRTRPIGYRAIWTGSNEMPLFNTKREAREYCYDNPNGPPSTPKLVIVNGKREWI